MEPQYGNFDSRYVITGDYVTDKWSMGSTSIWNEISIHLAFTDMISILA